MRLRTKLPLSFILATLVFAGIVALAAALVLRGIYLDRLEDDMSRQARQFAAVLEDEALRSDDLTLQNLQSLTNRAGDAGRLRLTVIARDGSVLADSEADPTTLDNHARRPEVNQALAGNEGRARRESTTLDRLQVCVAVPLSAGETAWSQGVVRAAQPAGRIDSMVAASWEVPLIMWAVLLLPIFLLSLVLTRSLTTPVERLRQMTRRVASGDLAYRTGIRRKDELGELANSLNAMAEELEKQMAQSIAEEERSTQMLSALSDGVIVLDDAGRFISGNPAAERILRADLQDLEGNFLVQAARWFPDRMLAQKAREAGGPVTEVVELAGQRYLAVEVIPLHAAEHEQGRTLFVIRDETARLSTERMRRDFVTNVSHELKTPLASLSLLAETLEHAVREDPEQAEVFVKRLSAEIGRLTELTNDLLILSRLEERGAAYDLCNINLDGLVEETAAESRPQADTKNQELSVDVTPGVVVMGNDTALRTLVRNLLENAIRYTEPAGHIAVTLRTEPTTDGRQWAVITVRDDGIGIPVAEQRRIFERFYRVDKARSRATGGSGLGLSIVRHIAERHGGRVSVVSTVGSGSTFTVRIPAL